MHLESGIDEDHCTLEDGKLLQRTWIFDRLAVNSFVCQTMD